MTKLSAVHLARPDGWTAMLLYLHVVARSADVASTIASTFCACSAADSCAVLHRARLAAYVVQPH
jgi:hypothetical protein